MPQGLSSSKSPFSHPGPCFPQELLNKLYVKGPSAEGIFRPAASKKAHRELKEALDTGGDVDRESQTVHLLAVIVKVNSFDFGLQELLATLQVPLQ